LFGECFAPFSVRLPIGLLLGCAAALSLPAAASTFTLTASNVSISGQGTATGQFTLTSVDGFSGTVGVSCVAPDPNVFTNLVLPDCRNPVEEIPVPANGSVSGTMNFYPPWAITPVESHAYNAPRRQSRPLPLTAGVLAGLGLLGLRMRRLFDRRLALLAGAVCLGSLGGLCGCLNSGGLAMTPGTYIYELVGVPPSGVANQVTTNFYVTVKCNSCP
jgi:hypothetical protein